MHILLKYTLAWIPLLFIAVANGASRDLLYGQHLPALMANQLSCGTGILLFTGYTWLLERKFPLSGAAQAIQAGCIWLALTLAFEFLFFHYVAGHPWDDLLKAYRVWEGQLWVLVLLAVAGLPYAVFRGRGGHAIRLAT